MMAETHNLTVNKDDLELRLDQFISREIPALSRRKARLVIEIGGVFINNKRVKVSSRKLKIGQIVTVHMGGALEKSKNNQHYQYKIVFEDEDLVVINKPSGLITAPTPESDRGNLKYLLENRSHKPCKIFVVHRLDKDTSGILVMAKSTQANIVLSQSFKEHSIERRYLAVVRGHLEKPVLMVDSPIKGKRAVTHIRQIKQFADCTEIEATLETGRTHQIRLHCRLIGHEVLGDPLYGKTYHPRPPSMVLHAKILAFKHPIHHHTLKFEESFPTKIKGWISELKSFKPGTTASQ